MQDNFIILIHLLDLIIFAFILIEIYFSNFLSLGERNIYTWKREKRSLSFLRDNNVFISVFGSKQYGKDMYIMGKASGYKNSVHV